jgi:DNA-directed RNA polymerase specialized sigma24 family protein
VGYDREYIADTIILQAWERGLDKVSRRHIHYKCIDVWRRSERERKAIEGSAIMISMQTNQDNSDHTKIVEDKTLIDQITKSCLYPSERKLIWMRFYNYQTIEEISANIGLPPKEVSKRLDVALYKMRVELMEH